MKYKLALVLIILCSNASAQRDRIRGVAEVNDMFNGLPKGTLQYVIDKESMGNPNAHNRRTHAHGLMQIMPRISHKYRVNPNDPVESIEFAGWMIKKHYQRYHSIDKALAAYNWGSGNLAKYGLRNAPRETRQYIKGYHQMVDGR